MTLSFQDAMTAAKLSSSKAVQYPARSIGGRYSLKRVYISMLGYFETSSRLKTCASINSEIRWRQAKCRSFPPFAFSTFCSCVQSCGVKHRLAILSHNFQSSMAWEISFAIVAAVLSWGFGTDNSFIQRFVQRPKWVGDPLALFQDLCIFHNLTIICGKSFTMLHSSSFYSTRTYDKFFYILFEMFCK